MQEEKYEADICCIVPAYNEAGTIRSVVEGCRRYVASVVVVDDGSGDSTAAEAEAAGARLIRHTRNLGKGAAIRAGFAGALDGGFEAAVTLDADGQHDPAEIPRFVSAMRGGGGEIIVGHRLWDSKSIPLVRYLSNRFGSFFISLAAGQRIPDSQSGYRLYTWAAMALGLGSEGFEAETEVLIKASKAGLKIGSIPIRAIYRQERKSHFRPVRDFIKIAVAVFKTRKGETA